MSQKAVFRAFTPELNKVFCDQILYTVTAVKKPYMFDKLVCLCPSISSCYYSNSLLCSGKLSCIELMVYLLTLENNYHPQSKTLYSK